MKLLSCRSIKSRLSWNCRTNHKFRTRLRICRILIITMGMWRTILQSWRTLIRSYDLVRVWKSLRLTAGSSRRLWRTITWRISKMIISRTKIQAQDRCRLWTQLVMSRWTFPKFPSYWSNWTTWWVSMIFQASSTLKMRKTLSTTRGMPYTHWPTSSWQSRFQDI